MNSLRSSVSAVSWYDLSSSNYGISGGEHWTRDPDEVYLHKDVRKGTTLFDTNVTQVSA